MQDIELQTELRRAAQNSGFSAPVVARLFVRGQDACIDCEDYFAPDILSDEYKPLAAESLPEAHRLADWIKERFSILSHRGDVFVYDNRSEPPSSHDYIRGLTTGTKERRS